MKATNAQFQSFVNTIRLKSKTEVIENASEDSDLMELAKVRGIDTTKSKDLAFIKHIYAVTEEANLNKCRLPKETIEQALDTIVGKPIDIDHIRGYVIGHYMGAKLIEDTIYAYGVIYKMNFEDEWSTVKELFDKGELATSFEIWCAEENKEYHADGTFSLLQPTIAGGAILFRTKPACPKARVLEVAKKNIQNNVLYNELIAANFATNTPDDVIVSSIGEDMKTEQAKFYTFDTELFHRLLAETKCPGCDSAMWDINQLDFDGGIGAATCINCQTKASFSFIPKAKVEKASDLKFNFEVKEKEDMEKIQELEAKIAGLEAELASARQEIATKDEAVKALEEAKSQLDVDVQTKLAEAVAQVEEKIALAKAQTKTICERRAELGEEFAKEVTDEDILDDAKFELAKMKKENAELKAKLEAKATAAVAEPVTAAVTGVVTAEDEVAKKAAERKAIQDRVNKLAFAKK